VTGRKKTTNLLEKYPSSRERREVKRNISEGISLKYFLDHFRFQRGLTEV